MISYLASLALAGLLAFGGPPAAASPSAACASCHRDVATEWKHSRHAVSFDNALFQGEWRDGRKAWCVGCHAPLVEDPTQVAQGDPRARDGIGCVACHADGGAMVSSSRAANSPHDTHVDPSFGTAGFCRGCHEFEFPILDAAGRATGYTGVPMQETVSQFEATSHASHPRQCLACHMDGAEAGHGFPGSHQPEMVARAVSMSVCRSEADFVVTLHNRGAAHAVPTGGVHRRIALRLWSSNAPASLFQHVLGRTFRPAAGGGKTLTSDSTLPAGKGRTLRVPVDSLGARADQAVHIELRYIYALDEHEALADGSPTSRPIHQRSLALADLEPCATRP